MADFSSSTCTQMDATALAKYMLDFYMRGSAYSQTMQERPFLAWLRSNQQTFPGGKGNIDTPIQGAYASDSASFVAGYTGYEQLVFSSMDNMLRVYYAWKEIHMGWAISHTELKQDGITITQDGAQKTHSRAALTRLSSVMQNRLEDFGESTARGLNLMCWKDGTQDSEQIVGLTGIISPNTPAASVASIGGQSPGTYTWWRYRDKIGANKITASKVDQTLTKTLRAEVRQLRRFGGRPNAIFAGSGFIEAAEDEVHEKGIYTQEGFTNAGKTDIGMADIRMRGVGSIQYDPTMDDLGLSKFAYFLDSRRLRLRPMEGEDMKKMDPTRPYDYMVFLQSVTWTGGMECIQLNACGVYEVA